MIFNTLEVVRQIKYKGLIHKPIIIDGNLLLPMGFDNGSYITAFYYEIPGELIKKICKEEEQNEQS